MKAKSIKFSGALSLAAVFIACPAMAQEDAVPSLDAMRECAVIADPSDRLACYDSLLDSQEPVGSAVASVAGETPAADSQIPKQQPAIQASAPSQPQPIASNEASANDFGLPEPRPEKQARPTGIVATVSQIRQRQPGVYLLTMDDGAQWLFTESVRRTYRLPRRGASVSIDNAALNSFLLRYDRQAAVRVRRIR